MDQLVLHPQTRQHIERCLAQPSHAILLIGAEGIGKHTVAMAIMQQLLGLDSLEAVSQYPYTREVVPEKDKSSIGIEAIRELQHFASLKLPGGSKSQQQLRFIFVPKAHAMTTEAQNGLLKLLEEPPQDTHFIMTADSAQQLLPTVRSRSQQLTLNRPSKADLEQHFQAGYDAQAIQQAYLMSGGLPGLMTALLSNEDHPMRQAAQTARQLLQASQFERLCKVDELSKKKPEALQVLAVLRHMAQAAIEQSAQAAQGQPTDETTTKRLKQWHKILQASFEAEKSYDVSAQAKLVLTNLMLAL